MSKHASCNKISCDQSTVDLWW